MHSMVRTRIAPSPTGFPHIGTIYQAMLDRAFSSKNKGKFCIRIEDTDQSRFVQGAEEKIYEALDWFGLTEDESPRKGGNYGPYRQSERLPLYKKYAEELVKNRHAYYCFCTPERLDAMRKEQQKKGQSPLYDKKCRSISTEEGLKRVEDGERHVIRMKIPDTGTVTVPDNTRGEIVFNVDQVDDQVIMKSDGFPTYHLAVVVDDHLMEITHVLRGSEWIPSFPKHKLLYDYFGWKMPIITHTPLITNMDGSKMSKRHGHASVSWYQEEGFLGEAVLNFMSLLGWSHPEEKELFSFEEFTLLFDFKDLSALNPKFDLNKLMWMNGEYIRKYESQKLKVKIQKYLKTYLKKDLNDEKFEKTIPLVQTRMKTLKEYWPLIEFIFEEPKKIELDISLLKSLYSDLIAFYKSIDWKHDIIYSSTEKFANEHAIKPVKLYMDIRYALSNKKITAPLFEGMEIMGKEEVLRRLGKIK